MKVLPSVTGATSQTPVMPKIIGKTPIEISKTTSPLDADMRADSFALPIEVK